MSLVDMYIDNSEPSENVGQIHFSLEYDFQNTTLILRIIQVRAITVKAFRLVFRPQSRNYTAPAVSHFLKAARP